MKLQHVLEASYQPHPDTVCRDCKAKFNFNEEAEHGFFKDDVKCPNCGVNVFRDSRIMIKTKKPRRAGIGPSAEHVMSRLREARYFGDKRSPWLRDAMLIAKTNMDQSTNEEEWEFWDDYKVWLNENTKMLSQIYDVLKADRNTFLEQFEARNPDAAHRRLLAPRGSSRNENDRREYAAELWSGNMSHEEFPILKEFIRLQDNKERVDYTMMVGNTMFDLLGGLRDEH